jgi:hypothetical protein
MVLKGIVRNGRVEVATPPEWAEGSEVYLELWDAPFDDESDSSQPGTREEELAILREAIAEAKAGVGQPLEEVMAEIEKEFGYPPVKRRP